MRLQKGRPHRPFLLSAGKPGGYTWPMQLIDSHCHLDFDVFDEDREQLVQEAGRAGISHIVIPATTRPRWQKINRLCRQFSSLFPCYGLHPYFVEQHRQQDIETLADYASKHDCVAIGECGLDFRPEQAERKQQLFYFEAQLEIARQLDKPVVIHAVKATQQVIASLKKFPGLRGMVHSYSGSYEQAMQLIDTGFCLGFGGAASYLRARRLRNTLQRLPLDHLLLETDAPDQSDRGHRQQRNQPAWLVDILEAIAELRDENAKIIAQQTTHNACRLFSLPLTPVAR